MLAKAAGIHIGELDHIDYSWGKVDFEVRPVQDVCFESCGMAPAGGISMDIEPDDMEAEDTVTVVWEIINENNAYCMEGPMPAGRKQFIYLLKFGRANSAAIVRILLFSL